ncbi:copper chaperone CopZ [Fontibacillus phaseoli]|uniref:Copper chaperone CopZ n=1 Tax=Fontibacillus phaseoli TaxID=1416533 RepID=A0A369B969_9BACL|nr:heavy-metal-associated domain-containing protein [Fontibacillus phaseoli]RCX18079.1 copper chaperone CopZ [Fontibacillus phaseoli]
MKKLVLGLEPLSCPSCIKKIDTALNNTAGVDEAKVLFHAGKVRIKYHEEKVQPEALRKVISELGYPVISQNVS